jgi:hypothetical protein
MPVKIQVFMRAMTILDHKNFRLSLGERRFLERIGYLEFYYRRVPHQITSAIYKFVRAPEHADALAKGDVYVSTLNACRAYECSERGDPGEGTLTHFINRFVGTGDEWKAADPLRGRRLDIAGPMNVVISDCELTLVARDGYVFCATDTFDFERMAESFGHYCVRIRNPLFFQLALCHRLAINLPVLEHWGQLVQYTGRNIVDTQPLVSREFFLKPKRYEGQREFRIVAMAHDPAHRYEPHTVRVDNISRFIERIR